MNTKFYQFDLFNSLPPEVLVGVVIAFALLHIGILFCIAFLKKQIHPMYFMLLVISTMFYVSPFDMVTTSEVGRWFRVYLIAMTAIIGLLLYRPKRLGPPAKVALIYAFFMIITAAKSADAAAFVAVAYKSIFLGSLIACLCIAHSVRDPKQLFKQLHWFIGLMAIYAINYLFYIAASPASIDSRFNYGTIPVMQLAVSVASVAVISCFVAMYDTAKRWKVAATFVTIVMVVVILLTGSRGPTFALAIASFCMLLPLVKRPGLLISFVVLVALGVTIVVHSGLEIPYLDRAIGLQDLTEGRSLKDASSGRFAIWQRNLTGFYQNPVLGCGFMETGMKGGMLHSSYVQLIAEGGIVGVMLFLTLGATISYCFIFIFTRGKRNPEIGTLRILPIGCIAFAGLIGISESSLVYGTNLNAVVLMLGIGYLDWMYMSIKYPKKAKQVILIRRKKVNLMQPVPSRGYL